jgi:predicted XRE-type DNA-binding protein
MCIIFCQQDNCDEADVQINAILETNELHQSKIAEIIEYDNGNSSHQFELVYKDYR